MNAYQLSGLGFAQAYKASMDGAGAQRRANQPTDSAFANADEETERSMIGSPAPQPPDAPNEQFNGYDPQGAIDSTQESRSIMQRAKKRAGKYLGRPD